MGRLVEDHPIDVDAIAEVNDSFHQGLLEACGNRRLRDLLGTITEVPLQISTFRRYSIDAPRPRAAPHSELVSELAVGAADWARSVTPAHTRSARHPPINGRDPAEGPDTGRAPGKGR